MNTMYPQHIQLSEQKWFVQLMLNCLGCCVKKKKNMENSTLQFLQRVKFEGFRYTYRKLKSKRSQHRISSVLLLM